MPATEIHLADASLTARASGALHWKAQDLLVVGDLHLGRSERMARIDAGLLPPYENAGTLARLGTEIAAIEPRMVICLGDSFDDLDAVRGLDLDTRRNLEEMAADRRWIWVAGNHDPGPVALPGEHVSDIRIGAIDFRHIANPTAPPEGRGEVSAHYHPKARLTRQGRRITRPCFVADRRRLVLPAFGTYTGGLDVLDAALRPLFEPSARAWMLGPQLTPVSLDRLG